MNLEAMISTDYLHFSRSDAQFFLDIRHVREIVDGTGFVLHSEVSGLRSVSLRNSRLQVVDLATRGTGPRSQRSLPLIIVVELNFEAVTALVGVVADRVESKLIVGNRETSLANTDYIDAEQVLRATLPGHQMFATH